MAKKVLLTGFPGFLGSELVRRILRRPGDAEVLCLVQAKFAALATRRAEEIAREEKVPLARIALVEGDITEPGGALQDVVQQRVHGGLPAVWAGWAELVGHLLVAGKPKSKAADRGDDGVGRGGRELERLVVGSGSIPQG